MANSVSSHVGLNCSGDVSLFGEVSGTLSNSNSELDSELMYNSIGGGLSLGDLGYVQSRESF